MTSEVELKMVSRRRMLPFLGLAAAAGLALRYTAAEAQTTGSRGTRRGSKAARLRRRRQERRGERVERRYERRGGTPGSKTACARPACARPACTRPSLHKNSS